MRKITDLERTHVLNVSSEKRYKYFINVVCDTQQAWGLNNDAWAMAYVSGKKLFPVWPAHEYAVLCTTGDWENYVPQAISTESILSQLIPSLKSKSMEFLVFPTPHSEGAIIAVEKVSYDIQEELKRY